MKRTTRRIIEGYDYEIDDQGQLFSLVDVPGFGIGYQLMPSKTRKTGSPTYKLTRNGEHITCRANVLVEQYFTTGETFDSKWYWRTRKAAKEHNAELRTAFLNRNSKGLPHPAPVKLEAKEEKRKPYVYVPWGDLYRMESSAWEEERYSAALGSDSRDALICPLR